MSFLVETRVPVGVKKSRINPTIHDESAPGIVRNYTLPSINDVTEALLSPGKNPDEN